MKQQILLCKYAQPCHPPLFHVKGLGLEGGQDGMPGLKLPRTICKASCQGQLSLHSQIINIGLHCSQACQPNHASSRPPRSYQERNAARQENWSAAYLELAWQVHASQGSKASSKQHARDALKAMQVKQYQDTVGGIMERGSGL